MARDLKETESALLVMGLTWFIGLRRHIWSLFNLSAYVIVDRCDRAKQSHGAAGRLCGF